MCWLLGAPTVCVGQRGAILCERGRPSCIAAYIAARKQMQAQSQQQAPVHTGLQAPSRSLVGQGG